MAKLARSSVLAAPISKEESAWFDLLLAELCTLEATLIKRNLATIKWRLITSSPLTVVVNVVVVVVVVVNVVVNVVVVVVGRKSSIVVLKLTIQSIVVVVIVIVIMSIVVVLVKPFPLIIEYIVSISDEGIALSLLLLLLESSLSLLS